jgi:hypothetical protein
MQNFEVVGHVISIVMIAFSLVFTLGIIWRVEMRLDMAYKVFFCALVFLFLSKLTDFFVESELLIMINQILNILFSAFLLLGIWLMRDLMRNIDGEKK